MKKFYLMALVVFTVCSCSVDPYEFETAPEKIQGVKNLKNNENKVTLMKAWTADASSPVGASFVRRFTVKVKNIAFQKSVSIYHEKLDGSWVDIPLLYEQSISNNEEIWYGEVDENIRVYADEFVVKYVVDGETYWDNNNDQNYSMEDLSGTYLQNGLYVSVDKYYTRLLNNYFAINVDIKKDYGFVGDVELVYTTDDWSTTNRAPLSYQRYFRVGYAQYLLSPNVFDVEKWATSVGVPEGTESIQFAVVYTVNGVEHWDNNHGKNHVFSKLVFQK